MCLTRLKCASPLLGEVSRVLEILTPTHKVHRLTPCPKEQALPFKVVLTVFMELVTGMFPSQVERTIYYILMS